jgi:hypothetical protein
VCPQSIGVCTQYKWEHQLRVEGAADVVQMVKYSLDVIAVQRQQIEDSNWRVVQAANDLSRPIDDLGR